MEWLLAFVAVTGLVVTVILLRANHLLRANAEYDRNKIDQLSHVIQQYPTHMLQLANSRVAAIQTYCDHVFVASSPPTTDPKKIVSGPIEWLAKQFVSDCDTYQCYPEDYVSKVSEEVEQGATPARDGEHGIFFLIQLDAQGAPVSVSETETRAIVKDGNIRWKQVGDPIEYPVFPGQSVSQIGALIANKYGSIHY